MHWLKHLTFAKLEFTIEAVQPLRLPKYKGSTFRGAFGNVFKNVVCIKEDRDCSTCILTHNCSYYYIFETPNSDKFPWFSSPKLPHPYILEPPPEERVAFEIGEYLKFNLVLFGKAIDYLPYFIFVFDELGRRRGLGKHRRQGLGRFWLKEVRDRLAGGNVLYDGTSKSIIAPPKIESGAVLLDDAGGKQNTFLTLNFLTPTRIRHKGDYLLFGRNTEVPVRVLLENLYRRAYLMIFSHCHDCLEPFELPDFAHIYPGEMDLHWHDWERYSNRQHRKHHFGGFLGKLVLKGETTPWLPLLKAGEVLHAGSATSFGLGKFVVGET